MFFNHGQYKIKIVDTHINNIIVGDTIMRDNQLLTVCKSNIKYCSFMGVSLFGSNYKCGHEPVKKVIFFNPLKDK